MRWWNELRAPTMKCARVGHRGHAQKRDGYLPCRGGYFGGVALSVRQEREVCLRCGAETVAWNTIRQSYLNSLTASEEIWDAIYAGGWWSDGSHKGRGVIPTPAGTGGADSHATLGDDANGMNNNDFPTPNTEERRP